jgi:uncharacterized protein
MILDISEFAKLPGATASYEVRQELSKDTGLTLIGEAAVSLHFTNTGSIILLRGSVSADLELMCSRCLETFPQRVEASIHEEFASSVPGVKKPTDTIERLEPREAAYSDGRLDVSELVRQHLEMSEPLRPLCRQDCLGICPRCGSDLNLGPCRCSAGAEQSPPGSSPEAFVALKQLLEQKKGKRG